MSEYYVSSNGLNIRSAPIVKSNTRLAVLQQGQSVTRLDGEEDPWWLVETELFGGILRGYVHSKYLKESTDTFTSITSIEISAVHLSEADARIERNRNGGRAHALGEKNMPKRTANQKATKLKQIIKIIDWLNVEDNARYLPQGSLTYCNVYAYDYCYLNNVYIPRVWWTQSAIRLLEQGERVHVNYGNTVRELNANSLHDWFVEFGDYFGWKRIFSVDEAQLLANSGEIIIACAKRVNTNSSGHICAIAPENGQHFAKRSNNGSVSRPLQSQAGSSNFKFKAANQWWTFNKYQDFGIWRHE